MSVKLALWSAMGLALTVLGGVAVVRRKVTLASRRSNRLGQSLLRLRGGPAVLAGGGALLLGLAILGGLARSASRPGGADMAAVPDAFLWVFVAGLLGAGAWQLARNLRGFVEDPALQEKVARKVEEAQERAERSE